jgi:beta-N-acetylhexosaminidase
MVALLLHQRSTTHRTRPAGSSGAESQRLSAAAITSVDGACTGRLVGRQVRVTGPASAVARFRGAAASAGLKVVEKQKGMKRVPATTVRLVGHGGAAVRGDVVVALDTPYVLGRSTAGRAKIATYGESAGAMNALVSVLLGRAQAPGRLPVEVPGVSRDGC